MNFTLELNDRVRGQVEMEIDNLGNKLPFFRRRGGINRRRLIYNGR